MVKIKVSVIITTYNSEETLDQLLKSLQDQSFKQFEVIVVDNKSTDQTVKIAQKYTSKVFQQGPERSSQRNFGAQKAVGEYFLFLDSDMVLSHDVLSECFEIAQKNQEFGGIIIPEQSFGKGFWAQAKILERDINQGQSYFEAARFFSKKVFWQVEGYDITLTGPEDWDLPRRIGKKFSILRIKSKIYHNEGELTLKTLIRKKYYYGLSLHKFVKKQQINLLTPTTVYFLRPAFYKNWQKLLKNPLISLGMIIMLICETAAGGLGYIRGRFQI